MLREKFTKILIFLEWLSNRAVSGALCRARRLEAFARRTLPDNFVDATLFRDFTMRVSISAISIVPPVDGAASGAKCGRLTNDTAGMFVNNFVHGGSSKIDCLRVAAKD
jgi:hypothetical protein